MERVRKGEDPGSELMGSDLRNLLFQLNSKPIKATFSSLIAIISCLESMLIDLGFPEAAGHASPVEEITISVRYGAAS